MPRLLRVLSLLIASLAVSNGRMVAADDVVSTLAAMVQKAKGEISVQLHKSGDLAQGLVAAKTVNSGEPLALVPLATACYKLPDLSKYGIHGGAASILDDSLDAKHPQKQLLDTLLLPQPGGGVPGGVYAFPDAYLPLLQSPDLAKYITDLKVKTRRYWDKNCADLAEKGFTYDQFVQVVNHVATKSFSLQDAAYIVPLIDLTQHRIGCGHTTDVDKCKGGGDCVVWTAGSKVNKGEGVCADYGRMFPDQALVLFGEMFGVPAGNETHGTDEDGMPLLSAVDRKEFDIVEPWYESGEEEYISKHQANPKKLGEESKRLKAISQELEAADAKLAKVAAVPEDKGGELLSEVRRWRTLRKASLAAQQKLITELVQDVNAAGEKKKAAKDKKPAKKEQKKKKEEKKPAKKSKQAPPHSEL